MKWKPIESAPRDGSRILVWGGTLWSDSGWGTRFFLTEPDTAWWKDGIMSGWCLGNDEAHDEFIWAEPTHWMPLPPPPTVGET